MKDYYAILGVAPQASADDIKKAYRNLVKEHHPDKGGDAAKFQEISEAYDVIGSDKRRQYDAERQGQFNFHDIFNIPRGPAREVPQKGPDIELEVEIPVSEVFKDTTKRVLFTRQKNCDRCKGRGLKDGCIRSRCKDCDGRGQVTRNMQVNNFTRVTETVGCAPCRGTGRVIAKADACPKCEGSCFEPEAHSVEFKVPAGISEEYRINARGEGNVGRNGGPTGDVFCRFKVVSPVYKREGNHLIRDLKLKYWQMCLGDTIKVTLPNDELAHVVIPANCPNNSVIRLAGRGLPPLRGGERGDVRFVVQVEIPRSNEKQLEILKQLKELDNEEQG